MTWIVEAIDAYEAWESARPRPDMNARVAVLEWLMPLQIAGPPDNAEFDPHRETYSCPVRGTSVRVEFVSAPYLHPPTVMVRRFF